MNKKPWIWVPAIIIVIIIISPPAIVNIAYLNGTKNGLQNTAYSASDIIIFYGSVLSFIGTVTLGILALWQNKIIQQNSDEYNKKLLVFSKSADELNNRMFKLEELKYSSIINLESSTIATYSLENAKAEHGRCIAFKDKSLSYDSRSFSYQVYKITNVSESDIIDMKINNYAIILDRKSNLIELERLQFYSIKGKNSSYLLLSSTKDKFSNFENYCVEIEFFLYSIYGYITIQKFTISHKNNCEIDSLALNYNITKNDVSIRMKEENQ